MTTTIRRAAASAALAVGLGVGLAAPASAQITVQPGPLDNPSASPTFPFLFPCTQIGGVFTPAPAYPPAAPNVFGTCTYRFGPDLTIIGSGNQIQINLFGLAPFTIVFGPAGPNGAALQTTADANGNATLAIPSGGDTNDVALTTQSGDTRSTVTVPTSAMAAATNAAAVTAANVVPADPASSLGGNETDRGPADVPAPAPAPGDGTTAAAVRPASFTEVTPTSAPSSDRTMAYTIAGGAILGAVALSGGVAVRRRRQD